MYSNELICKVLDFLDNNINRKVSIEEISSKFYYNRYYIMKLFKKEIGISIANYMNLIRIYNSAIDIRDTSYSFTKIAIRNGFYSLEYFSEMFHNIMGVSPSIYSKYCQSYYFVDEYLFENIINNFIKLQDFIEFVRYYKKNKKPIGNPVLKLSIFK